MEPSCDTYSRSSFSSSTPFTLTLSFMYSLPLQYYSSSSSIRALPGLPRSSSLVSVVFTRISINFRRMQLLCSRSSSLPDGYSDLWLPFAVLTTVESDMPTDYGRPLQILSSEQTVSSLIVWLPVVRSSFVSFTNRTLLRCFCRLLNFYTNYSSLYLANARPLACRMSSITFL